VTLKTPVLGQKVRQRTAKWEDVALSGHTATKLISLSAYQPRRPWNVSDNTWP